MARLRSVLRPLGRSTLAPAKHLPTTPIRLSSGFAPELKKTPLYDLHVAHGAKMVPFAEHSMPAQYGSHSVHKSHLFTRRQASLFDLSHMVQHTFTGPGAAAALEWLSPAHASKMPHGKAQLSALLQPTGGIVDDFMITRVAHQKFHVVTNAACRAKDIAHIGQEISGLRGVDWSVEERAGLLALQGPGAAPILRAVVRGFETKWLFFGTAAYGQIKLRDGTRSRDVLVSRGGYTGEDGFEISLVLGQEAAPGDVARELTAIAETLLDFAGPEKLRLAGLGARDSLRLEAGMCLSGHDIDETTTPVEAGLGFIIPRERREELGFGYEVDEFGREVGELGFNRRAGGLNREVGRFNRKEGGFGRKEGGLNRKESRFSPEETGFSREEGGFIGAEVVLPQLIPKSEGGEGVKRKRVGLVITGALAREGAEILTKRGEKLGVVTSGLPSPSLGENIAMGYVKTGSHEAGTEVEVLVRGKRWPAVVAKMPFVPAKHYRKEVFLANRDGFWKDKEARRKQHEADVAHHKAKKEAKRARHEATLKRQHEAKLARLRAEEEKGEGSA